MVVSPQLLVEFTLQAGLGSGKQDPHVETPLTVFQLSVASSERIYKVKGSSSPER